MNGLPFYLFPKLHNKTLLDNIYSPSEIRLETYSKEKLQKELVSQKEAYFSQGQENSLGISIRLRTNLG